MKKASRKKASLQWIWKQFCMQSTIHGAIYAGQSTTFISRCLWIAVTLMGFMMTAYLFSESKAGWDTQPVLTTIHSISKPVSSIQFPTVTLCPEKPGAVDNWALVEKVANFIKFECHSKFFPRCEETEATRERFSFLTDFVFRNMDGAIDLYLAQGNPLPELDYYTNDFARWMAYHLYQNLTTLERQRELMRTSFGKDSFPLSNLVNFTVEEGDPPVNCEIAEECRSFFDAAFKLSVKAQLMFPPTGFMPLGTAFAAFLPLFMRTVRKTVGDEIIRSCADDLTDEEEIFHGFLAELSAVVGLGDDKQAISLFDVPTIFGFRRVNELFEISPRNNVIFTKCAGINASVLSSNCPFRYEFMAHAGEPHPCDSDYPGECCHYWTNLIHTNLTTLMRVMRHSMHSGASHEDLVELMNIFNNTMTHHWFNRMGYGESRYSRNVKRAWNAYTMLPMCEYISGQGFESLTFSGWKAKLTSCDLFRPVPTNNGICYAFNSHPVTKTMQDSPFVRAFLQAYRSEQPREERTLEMGVGADEHMGLTIYIDRQTFGRSEWRGVKEDARGTFYVSVNNAGEAFQMRSARAKVRIGHVNEILVTPRQLAASYNLRHLSVTKRQCLFPDEGSHLVKLFANYTQSACYYECMLRFSAARCHCVPWDYPSPPGTVYNTCDTFGYYCFEIHMKNITETKLCNCPADCETLEFTFTEKARPIDVGTFCHERDFGTTYSFYKTLKSYRQVLFNFNAFVFGEQYGPRHSRMRPSNFEELCKHMASTDMAIVVVKLASEKLTEVKQEIRAGLADQMAAFGGTLGLFTGMSFISFVEIAYWLWKALLVLLKPNKA